jgi:hypothetical protein
MNEASPQSCIARLARSRSCVGAGLIAAVVGLCSLQSDHSPGLRAADPPVSPAGGKELSIGGIPLFAGWPQQPDAAIVLSGETYGFLQPCGCTRPQKGGLERRAQFIQTLKAKGWPVAGVDLGDVYPETAAVQDQALLKYKTIMNALREMGYLAVSVGKTEFKVELDRVLGEYALQKQQPPFVLAGNVRGPKVNGAAQPLQVRFLPPGLSRPLVDVTEFATVGSVPLSVTGIVGLSLASEVMKEKLDPSISFDNDGHNGPLLKQIVANIAASPKKTELNILLFQGTVAEAKLLAGDFPQFQVILCQAEDSEPPQYPTEVAGKAPGQKTLLIQLGHKGRYVGVVGAFKRPSGGVDLKYQLVPLGEEYITPGTDELAVKTNPVLGMLENYARQVRDRKYVEEFPKVAHPSQILAPDLNLSYIGSARCQGCHAAETAKWNDTHHSHAFSALEKVAKRPSLRQFDGECIVCHTVGFNYKTGYESQQKTPHLMNVGCESCHGPGSGHAADPRNVQLLKLQEPWKQQPTDRLPDNAFMKKMADLNGSQRGQVQVPPQTQLLINKTSEMCMRCHNHENDPNFDLYTYWPKIAHRTPGK